MTVVIGDNTSANTNGTTGDDYLSGAGNTTGTAENVRGFEGNDTLYGDLIGQNLTASRTYAIGTVVTGAVRTQLGSATASTAGGTTSYTFSSNPSYAIDVYYVEPNGNLTLVTSRLVGEADVTISGYPSSANFVITNYSTGEMVDYASLSSTGSTSYTHVPGAAGADNMIGDAGDDYMFGNAGDDTIYGDEPTAGSTIVGNDHMSGGSGNDYMWGGAGADKMSGDAGNDTISGELGNDVIAGGDGSDWLAGGDGADVIHGDNIFLDSSQFTEAQHNIVAGALSSVAGTYGSASDFSTTGTLVNYNFKQDLLTGVSVYYVNPNGDLVYMVNLSLGNARNISVPAGAKFVFVNTSTGVIVGATPTSPTPGTQTIDTGTYGDANFYQNLAGAADTISGGDGNDTIHAEQGNDSVDAGTGHDKVYADTGDDTISGNTGHDLLSGGDGNDLIYGNLVGQDTVTDGNDTIRAGDGDDTIYGQEGADDITGDAGNDFIDGGLGNDQISGNGGSDTIAGGAGNDTIFGDGYPSVTPRTGTTDYQSDFLDSSAGSLHFFSSRTDGVTPTTQVTFTNPLPQNVTVYYVNPDGSVQTDTMGVPGTDSGSSTVRTFTIPEGGNVIIVDDFTGGGKVLAYYSNVNTQSPITITPNTNLDPFVVPGAADTIDGGIGDDVIHGGDGGDSIVGGTGNDTIYGDSGSDFINGGSGVDSLIGGVGSDDITVGVGDVASGGDDEDVFTLDLAQLGTGTTFTIDGGNGAGTTKDYDSIVLAAGLTRVRGSMVSTTDADGNSQSGTIQFTDGTNTYTVNFTEIEGPICFARGTEIMTEAGVRKVEDLMEGDLVLTRDNGYKPIAWIGSRSFENDGGETIQRLSPIRIGKGSLGKNRPERDLYVSPQHRILVRSQITRRMFDEEEVLVAAKHLLDLDGVDQVTDFDTVQYFHLLFDRHEIVYANGVEAESLHTGPEAMRSLPFEARQEIFTIFPELAEQIPGGDMRSLARYVPKGKQARKLAERQRKNSLSLQ